MDSKESGAVEQATFEIMSKLVDFNKHDFVIDKSGMVTSAPLIKGEDGIVRPDTANTRSVQAIFNLAQNTVNRLDVDTAIQNKIKLIAKRVVSSEVAASYAREGREITTEGLRYTNPDEYKKLKAAIEKELTASDLDIASILSDYRNEYEVIGDAATYDKNKNILLDLSGPEVNVTLTDEQRARAKAIISEAIDFQSGGSRIQKATSKLAAPASDGKKMSAKEMEAYLKGNDPNYTTWGEFVLKHANYVDKKGNTVKGKILPAQFNKDFEGYDLFLEEIPPTRDNKQTKTTFTLKKNGTPILTNFSTTDGLIKRIAGDEKLIEQHNTLYEQVGSRIASRDAGTVRGGGSSLNANTWGQN
jgi:phage gpG-like protein